MNATPVSSRTLYFRLLGYVRPYWRVFLLAVVAMMLMAATEPLFPALLKPILDKGFVAGNQREDLYLVPFAIVAIFLVRGIFGYIGSYAMSWVSNRVIADLRDAMFARIVRLPTDYFEANPSSRLITRIVNDVNGVSGATTAALTTLIKDSLTIVGLLAWLLYLNWQLTLIVAVVGPLAGWVVRAFSSRLRASSLAAQHNTAIMTQALQEAIDGHKLVKVYGGEAQEVARFGRISNELRRQSMRWTIAASATVPIVQLLAAIALAIVVYIALLQSSAAQTTVGGFVSFVTAMLMLLSPVKHLADVNGLLQRGLAAAESVFTLLDESEEADRGTVSLGRSRGKAEFRQVTFRYSGAGRNALHRIDFIVEPGQTVALVGASGSGKTTLANLLPRFHRPTSGTVLIDDVDIDSLTLASLRANISLVSQDVVLFDDTVAANIAYGQLGSVTQERVEAAAKAAFAHDFISKLPEGYGTMIGENGVRLSGGQRQRLAIARALLKDAPILILDEATSALDTESERQVQAALETLMQGRTTLVIAHRLSTIEHADRILVLSHGNIVESGNHEQLLAKNGAYAQLYRLQYADET